MKNPLENYLSKKTRKVITYIGLFLLTLFSTTWAGAEWMYGRSFFYGEQPLNANDFVAGFTFSLPFLGILTFHEFGHYFTAKIHKLKASLPYYIPVWFGFIPGPVSVGTMGAFIKIREAFASRKQLFDVAVAGPLAGFIIALAVLFYGFTHLPPREYIYEIHPEYEQFGLAYPQHVYNNTDAEGLKMGTNLLFEFFKNYVAEDPSLVPNDFEIMHYPWLFAGFLALFFTALNLMPIGQLDGGHILYAMVGLKNHHRVSRALFVLFIYYAGLGMISFDNHWWKVLSTNTLYLGFLYLVFFKLSSSKKIVLLTAVATYAAQLTTMLIQPGTEGYAGWLIFGLILGRVLGLDHPPAADNKPIGIKRKIIGWLSLIIFVLCFSPQPFQLTGSGF